MHERRIRGGVTVTLRIPSRRAESLRHASRSLRVFWNFFAPAEWTMRAVSACLGCVRVRVRVLSFLSLREKRTERSLGTGASSLPVPKTSVLTHAAGSLQHVRSTVAWAAAAPLPASQPPLLHSLQYFVLRTVLHAPIPRPPWKSA